MNLLKTIIMILLQFLFMIVFFSCENSNPKQENTIMQQPVYTLGVWHVPENKQEEFIIAWKELGDIFKALPAPPGKGILIQSTSEPTLFYSFGPWENIKDIESMRNAPEAKKGLEKLIKLCKKTVTGSFHVVAES